MVEPPHTPRERRKVVKTPHFAVVPPRIEHPPPLESFGAPYPTDFKNGHTEKNHVVQKWDVESLLTINFERLHSQYGQVMAKLQRLEDLYVSNHHPKGILSRASEASHLYASRAVSSEIRAASAAPQSPLHQKRPFQSKPSVSVSGDRLGLERHVGFDSFDVRFSGSFHLSNSLFNRTSGENYLVMDKLAKIIAKHSKSYQRDPTSLAHRAWQFLENPKSSRLAFLYGSYFTSFLLLMGVIISFRQTAETQALPDDMYNIAQFAFELWFALEIAIRFLVSPDKLEFWLNVYNLIDLVSAIPLVWRIVAWAMDSSKDDSNIINGAVPMLRLLKILRRFHKFQLLVSAFGMALEALPVLLFALSLIAILFSGLIYIMESRSLIESLPMSLWFVIVTMTTVGYGDIVPETYGGSVTASTLMIISALYMAMPIGIVGAAFTEVWRDRDRLLLIAVLREQFAISGISKVLIREIFQFMLGDEDGNLCEDPELGITEFLRMMRALHIDVSDDRLIALFHALDVDCGGTISCDEFIQTLFPKSFIRMRPTRQLDDKDNKEPIMGHTASAASKSSKP